MADLDTEEVSYELLQELVRAERRSNRLMPVPARFWPDVRTFLANVVQEFRREQEKDPWSRKAMLLSDEAKNATHAAENLWALRERKLAMLAMARERERKRPEGVTAHEAQLFDALLATFDAARASILSDPAPPTAAPAAPPAQAPEPEQPDPPAQEVPPAGPPSAPRAAPAPPPPQQRPPAPPAPPAGPAPQQEATSPAPERPTPVVPPDTDADEESVTIRALGDIPPFVGPDMQTYLLKEGDLATVPPTIAQLLVKRKKAAVVEGF